MTSSVLSLVQDFCAKMTLPIPTALVGATEFSVAQLRALLAEVVRDLLEYQWEEQKIRKTFASVAAEDQGLLTTIFGAGYKGLVLNTLWNVTQNRQITGPLTDQAWQLLKSSTAIGPVEQYRVDGGHLRIVPTPPNTYTYSAIYLTAYGVVDTGGTAKAAVTIDSDTLLFPDNCVIRCLEYKWRRQKGEPWIDDYNDFISLLAKSISKDTAPILYLSRSPSSMRPGIVVPAGSWNV